MSVYGVHKLLKRLQRDPQFRERVQREPDLALAEFPLSEAERAALKDGDVATLNSLGVHGYLLMTLARFGLFGLTPERYVERIRQQAPVERR